MFSVRYSTQFTKKGRSCWEDSKWFKQYKTKQETRKSSKEEISEGLAEMEKFNIINHLGGDSSTLDQ